MPFPFAYVCDLLQQVADLPAARRNQLPVVRRIVQAWFATHRAEVDALVAASAEPAAAPLLAALLPDHRPDRVYGLQARGLQRLIVRALGLGRSRVVELSRWTRAGDGDPVDLADCVEAILARTPNPPGDVSVEEIDAVLHRVAARCRFSAPAVRAGTTGPAGPAAGSDEPGPQPSTAHAALGQLYRRLDARGAKWLTRLVLKDYRPVVLGARDVARAVHPALPLALQVHADLAAALQSLGGVDRPCGGDGDGGADSSRPRRPVDDSLHGRLRARLGVKVGRQQWAKARSIQHCLAMGGPQVMSCERKLDGEYVQVHVDLARGADRCLQLFSKSGKDSTWDRINLHGAIRDSLRIGQPDCPLAKGCILEGEMLVYDERQGAILDFDAVRRHVNRSGHRLFCSPDAPPPHEHPMIVYYDVLLVDDESLLATRHAERFRRLARLVACRPGHAELVPREVIDFGAPTAAAQLRAAFARCITARLEGLVVKPDNDPYFDFTPPPPPDGPAGAARRPPLAWPYLTSYAIKLKKEYIGAFGEVGDFAVLGGRYDAVKAKEYPPDLPGLRWTHFYLGCLDRAPPARPRFVVTNVVTLTVAQMATFLRHCRPRVVPVGSDGDGDGDGGSDRARAPFDLAPIEPGLDDSRGGPTELFADPPVVDLRCFSFHRPGYGRFWCPRFPSVVKFHFDRTYADALTFADLQAMAEGEAARRAEESAVVAAEEEEEDGADDDDDVAVAVAPATQDERAHWVAQLKRADPRGIAVDAETSQSSAAAATTPSTATTAQSESSGRSQSASHSQPAGAASVSVARAFVIDDMEEQEEGGASQGSAATSKPAKAVTVIDLTGDDDDDDAVVENDTRGCVSTPRSQCSLPPLPPLLVSPARAQTTPQRTSSSSSSSPIQLTSSLLAQGSTVPSSAATTDVSRSSSPCSQASHGQGKENEPGRLLSPSGRPDRKRLYTWDAASMHAVVSPPQLKRARTGL